MNPPTKLSATVVALVCSSLFLVTSASASSRTLKTTIGRNGDLEATKPFNSFGNFGSGVGDCQYETGANLILYEFPGSKITTPEVLSAYDQYGVGWVAVQTPSGPATIGAGQNYLLTYGFAGHRAQSIIPVTAKGAIVYAANHGGVEVANIGPTRGHMFAMVQATAKTVTLIDDGFVYHYSWKWFLYAYTYGQAQLFYYFVTW